MSRYYFHFSHGGDVQVDRHGLEYDDLQGLRADVMRTLLKSAADEMTDADGGEFAVEVQDGAGRRVLAATLSVRVDT
jgi:hypothetical protein